MNFANRFPFNLATRLTRDEAASTFNRLMTSQHVVDLQLIFVSTCVLMVVLLAVVVFITSSFENVSIPVAAILGAGFSVLAWTYQTGSARLGIVDLFGCEIVTICRVAAIVEIAPRYIEMYEHPPVRPPGFTSQEHYTPVFDNNSRDLEVLEARVVDNVTAFYTYLKTLRDFLRVLNTIDQPQSNPDEWRAVLRSVVYMLFLMLESGRRAVRRLVEYEPEREQHVITILLSELPAYGMLLKEFEAEAQQHPGYNGKSERLRLRKRGYAELVHTTSVMVNSHMSQKDRAQWLPAAALLEELNLRYRDALGEPAAP